MKVQFRNLVSVLGVVAVSLSVVGVANAQDAGAMTVQKPIRVKIGGFFPNDSSVKDAVSENFVSYGVSYDFYKTRTAVPALIGLYVDGIISRDEENQVTIGQQTRTVENSFSYVGVGPQVRAYFAPPTSAVNFYGGLGIGAYFINAKFQDETENSTQFGGKIFLGTELNNGFFGEVDYTLLGDTEITGRSGLRREYKPSGINASIGYRF